MMRKPAPKADRHQSLLVALRLAPGEKQVMQRLIERAEQRAGMVPGTLSAAAYSRSAVLDYMARQLVAIEVSQEGPAAGGPPAWEVIARAGEILNEEGGRKRREGAE